MSSLKQKTVSGVKWQMINKIGQKVISVVTFAILARMLDPSTFGLFAMSFLLIDGLQIFKSFGLDTALVQRKENVEEASHTAYMIVQAMGLTFFGASFLLAPLVSHFFSNNQICSVIRALGIVFVFSSFSKIPITLLIKRMQFNLVSIIDLIGAVVNSVCAIGFAIISPTVWALVGAYVAKQFTIAVFARFYSGYRFRLNFDPKIARALLSYGKFMIGVGVLGYVSENINNIVVGKILGTAMLGYFALAANIGNFINSHFTHLISGVMFPAYAKIQGDREAVKRVYLQTIKFVSIISIPFAVGLFFMADELVFTLYGEKWMAVIPLLKLFGIIQLIIPIVGCSGAVFLGLGNPGYIFAVTVVALVIKIPALFYLTNSNKLEGAVLANLVSMVFAVPMNLYLVRKLIPFSFREILQQVWPSLVSAIIMASTLYLTRLYIPLINMPPALLGHAAALLIPLFFGILFYVGGFFLFDRTAFVEMWRMLRPLSSIDRG